MTHKEIQKWYRGGRTVSQARKRPPICACLVYVVQRLLTNNRNAFNQLQWTVLVKALLRTAERDYFSPFFVTTDTIWFWACSVASLCRRCGRETYSKSIILDGLRCFVCTAVLAVITWSLLVNAVISWWLSWSLDRRVCILPVFYLKLSLNVVIA